MSVFTPLLISINKSVHDTETRDKFTALYSMLIMKRHKQPGLLDYYLYGYDYLLKRDISLLEDDFISSGGVDTIVRLVLSESDELSDYGLVLMNYTTPHFPRVCELLGSNIAVIRKMVSLLSPSCAYTKLMSIEWTSRLVASVVISNLRNISSADSARDVLIDNGVLDAVVADLNNNNDNNTPTKAPINAFGSMLTIANLIGTSEAKENKQLVMSEHILDTLVQGFKDGQLDTGKIMCLPMMLFPALTRLSISDKNKVEMVKKGIASIWISKLEYVVEDVVTLREMLELMFNLTMVEGNHKSLIDDGVVDELNKLNSSPHCSRLHKKLIERILWKLGGEMKADLTKAPTTTIPSATPATEAATTKLTESSPIVATTAPTLMISYNWDNQPLVKELADRLKRSGCKVWLDLDEMVGSSVEAMANAVESSQVVVVCLSRKYKESANCRLEGEYAFRRRKIIIPLLMQPRYDADGWLGAIIGTKIYYPVTAPDQVDVGVEGVLKELKKLGLYSISTAKETMQQVAQAVDTQTTPPLPSPSPSPATTPSSAATPTPQPHVGAVDWSISLVGEWLERIGLGAYVAVFVEQKMDGSALAYLARALQKETQIWVQCLLPGGRLAFNYVGDHLRFLAELEKLFSTTTLK